MKGRVHQAIVEEAEQEKRKLRRLLLKSNMTAHLDPEAVIYVLDCLLNIRAEDVEAMANHSGQVAALRRELRHW